MLLHPCTAAAVDQCCFYDQCDQSQTQNANKKPWNLIKPCFQAVNSPCEHPVGSEPHRAVPYWH